LLFIRIPNVEHAYFIGIRNQILYEVIEIGFSL
jgi:hypothetical protein